MAKPTTVVSFSNSLDIDGNPVWNDISSYVLSVDIGRGKSSDLDSYSSGTVSIVLNNRSRAFEPGYAASPFYGLIEPFGQVRVVSAGFTQFVGVIDSWSYGYSEKGLYATAQINANDNLALIAKNTLSANTFAAQLSGNRVKSILYGSDVYYNQPTCIDSGTRTITSDTVAEGAFVLDYLQKIGANDGALFYARRDGILAYQDSTLANTSGLSTSRQNLCVNPTFELDTYQWFGGSWSSNWAYQGTYSYAMSSSYEYLNYVETNGAKYAINTPYNVSFYIKNGSASVSRTVNIGCNLFNSAGSGYNKDSLIQTTITLNPNEVRRINLGVIKSALSTNSISLILDMGGTILANAFYIDCVLIEKATQLNKYFDGSSTFSAPSGQTYAFSWSNGYGSPHKSTSVMDVTVNTLIDYSVVTSITDSNYSGIKFNDVSMAYASEKLYNQISISGNSLTSSTSDLISQSKYGFKEYSVTDAILDNQNDNDSLASFLLSLYHLPDYRAESINLTLHNLSTTDQNTILAMDMLSQINLKFRPGNSGTALSANYQVIGINQSITPEEHTVELRVTSLDNFGFVLDHPALGILDTNRLV